MKGKVLKESITYVIIQIVIRIMVIYTVPLVYMVSGSAIEYEGFQHRYLLIFIFLGWIILFGILYLLIFHGRQGLWTSLKLSEGIGVRATLIVVITGIGFNFFINGFLWLLPIEGRFHNYEKTISTVMDHPFYLLLLMTGILIPIMEELFYRGILLNKLRQGFGIGMAIGIQALLFGIGHMNMVQGIYACFMGLIFGYVVMWTGSLYSAMIMHITINTTSIIWPYIYREAMDQTQLSTIIILGAAVVIIGMYFLKDEEERHLRDNIQSFKE